MPCPSSRVPRRVFASMALDENLRMDSSSGGVFSLLARMVLSRNGVVFGAAWKDSSRVGELVLRGVYYENHLQSLRGSKYLQARPDTSYRDARDCLQSGRPVLFSGTPCQIAGLKRFLGRDYNNLLSVEVICHGCSSPTVFADYIRRIEKRANAQCVSYFFRAKKPNWANYSISMSFSNGEERLVSHLEEPFSLGFSKRLYSRRACSGCPFRELKSGADITLGDFWHVDQYLSSMNDGKGTSLVLCNSEKGESAFWDISSQARSVETTFKLAVRINPVLCRSPKPHRNRHLFFSQWRGSPDLAALICSLTALSLRERIALHMRRLTYRARGKLVTVIRGRWK